ncbi:MAG: hypothetical protein HZB79_02995 [Deltaproteobacteria bacterium]|nr:hypothetical protein [Deltaproteobacteria bacterium]
MFYLYTIFHCNLAFSAIPKEHFPQVVERCYWPILKLCEHGFPAAIEMSAWTLKEVSRISPEFRQRLKELWNEGKCEFIGSGYSQAIMPLMPAQVNKWNLEIGNKYYNKLLGRYPAIALVNEQVYSKGLVDLYKDAGYEAIIMDWNNCCQYNHYPKEYLYFPQTAAGIKNDITVVWSHSIAFQKFQRCVHGELSQDEYLKFLYSHFDQQQSGLMNQAPTQSAARDCFFPIYGNDAEIFDYRPGEYKDVKGEYDRIRELFEKLSEDKEMAFILPSEIIKEGKRQKAKGKSKEALSFNKINLESPETPLPCKKQEKYNPTRWAAAGRDNVHINTQCEQAYKNILEISKNVSKDRLNEFKETLCFLWASDFRTSTTDEKFLDFQNKMGWLQYETEVKSQKSKVKSQKSKVKTKKFQLKDNILKINTEKTSIEFLCDKGLAIKSLAFPEVCKEPFIGTLEHGYYDDVHYGADFFTGHLINVAKDGKKITDLKKVEPKVNEFEDRFNVSCLIPIEIGTVLKEYDIYKSKPQVDITYRLKVNGLSASCLRLGIFTIMPDVFDKESLWFETVNGGLYPEKFHLNGHVVKHDESVSPTVSASSCLGATEGWLAIGDKEKSIRIDTDKAQLFSVPLLHYQGVDDKFFLRVYHSIGEIDDTAYWVWRGHNTIRFSVTGEKR